MSNGNRDRWGSRAAFILAAVGSAVGLGNIWRFPKAAFDGGGGAFLIPYFIALLTAGIPLLMLEFGLGHRMQGSAPAAMGRANKKWEFAGWWAALGGLFITFYYCVLMAWVCYYIWSIASGLVTGADALPWGSDATSFLMNEVVTGDATHAQKEMDFSLMNWPALIFNGLVWGFIYYAIRHGVHSVGKVVWVTVLVPYALLAVLFFTAITRDGAATGLSYYLRPEWSKFADPESGEVTLMSIANVAKHAYGQIFFSLSIGFGIMMAYASFLPKKSDIANNAVITAFANSGTEFFAGFITFSILGFLALSAGTFVQDQPTGGMGLALIAYPTAISEVTNSVVINGCIGLAFFISLLLLGIDSAFSLVEAMVAGAADKFGVSRKAITAIFCAVGWLVGIVFCTPGGLSLLDVVDNYLSNYGLLLIGLLQCIVVGWIYGTKNLRSHINKVSEKKITIFWDICIKYITPPVLILLLGLQFWGDFKDLISGEGKGYGGYETASQIIGISTLVVALVIAIFLTLKKPDNEDFLEIPEFDYDE